MNTTIKKLNEILSEIEQITQPKDNEFRIILERTNALADIRFGKESIHSEKITSINRRIINSYFGVHWSHINELKGCIKIMIDEIEITQSSEQKDISKQKNKTNSKSNTLVTNSSSMNVFIVHGHNEEMKQATARFIEKIGLTPIILHEQASNGKTIIEKFTDYSDVDFAIVNVSADDIGYSKKDNPEKAKYRARQNVIFELGYFIGKLGRNRVIALHETTNNFDILSDYQGVIYIPYDRTDNWKLSVVKELKAAGFDIDANKIT